MKSWCEDVEVTCAAAGWILTLSTQQFLGLQFKTQWKTEKFSLKYFVCHIFSCKTLYLQQRKSYCCYVTGTSPLLPSQNSKFQSSFDFNQKDSSVGVEFFFGFSNSEFIDDNSFHLKN